MSPQAPAAYPQLPHNVESVEQPWVGPGADPSAPRFGGAAPLCKALHLRKDFDALPLQASPLVLLDPAVVFFEKQTLLVTGTLLIFGKPARRFLD